MQYEGYSIQEAFHGYSFLIRDRFGRVVAEVPTIKEAQEWIDKNKKGVNPSYFFVQSHIAICTNFLSYLCVICHIDFSGRLCIIKP